MIMRSAVLCLILALPCVSHENPIPDTLALNEADALTCQVKGCRTITDGAYEHIADLIDKLKEKNALLTAELAKKPHPKYCL